jgi:hypothetical protein
MAQYGQGIGFNSRTYDGGLAGYISRHRTEHGATAAVAVIGILLAASLYAAITAPGIAGLIVVGAGVLFLLARFTLSANEAPAVVDTVRGLRYDLSCPQCTAGISVPVEKNITCPACKCPLTLMT